MPAHFTSRRLPLPIPRLIHQRALTQRDVVVLVVLLGVLGIVLSFPSSHSHELSRRTVCSSNLKGIGTGMYTYANENNDMWPIPSHAAGQQDGVGRVRYAPHKIGFRRMGIAGKPTPPSESQPAAGGSTTDDVEMSPTRGFWLLVRTGASTPKSFICPEDPTAEPNTEDNPQEYYDFRNYTEVSYGFQIPFGKRGQASSNLDQRMPLVADKGPYGFALEMGKPNPGTPSVSVDAMPEDWQKWNSRNHDSAGQVVLYADSHADFQTKPTCGIDNDNIYTRWSGAEGFMKTNLTARGWGVPPTGTETPWSDTDTFIYP